VANHIALNHSEVVVRRYKLIPEGGKLPKPEELPEDIRRKNFGNTYTRLHRNELSSTIVPGKFPLIDEINNFKLLLVLVLFPPFCESDLITK